MATRNLDIEPRILRKLFLMRIKTRARCFILGEDWMNSRASLALYKWVRWILSLLLKLIPTIREVLLGKVYDPIYKTEQHRFAHHISLY